MAQTFTPAEIKFIRSAFTSAYDNCARDAIGTVIEVFGDDYNRDITRDDVTNIIWPELKGMSLAR